MIFLVIPNIGIMAAEYRKNLYEKTSKYFKSNGQCPGISQMRKRNNHSKIRVSTGDMFSFPR